MSTLTSIPRLLLYSPARIAPAAGQPFSSHVLALPADGARLLLAGGDPQNGTALPVGAKVHVEVEDGARVLVFDTHVVVGERSAKGLWVARPQDAADYRVVQSRETLRAPIHCAVVAQFQRGSGLAVVRAETVDLGGGGARLRSKEPLPEKAQVKLRIALDAARPALQAAAHVIDCVRIATESSETAEFTHESRLQFDALDEAARQEILQRCFQHQIEQHKRRLDFE
jgi:c-di-GMP-binding flagellar brake protein YcgR